MLTEFRKKTQTKISKKYVESLEEEIKNIKNQIKEGNQPVFDSVEDMFKELDSIHKK